MTYSIIFLTAVALSMDALAVSIAAGVGLGRATVAQALRMGGCFGFFQAAMPLLGWLFGSTVSGHMEAFDHWLAFILLALIGGKMVLESRKAEDLPPPPKGSMPENVGPESSDPESSGQQEAATAQATDCTGTGETAPAKPKKDPTRGLPLLFMGVATSIDALAVGLSFSLLDMPIVVPALMIGLTTFTISFFGVYLGVLACKIKSINRNAELLGGLALIGIGIKILFDHGVF